MVVKCSEDAKAALNHIAFRKKAQIPSAILLWIVGAWVKRRARTLTSSAFCWMNFQGRLTANF